MHCKKKPQPVADSKKPNTSGDLLRRSLGPYSPNSRVMMSEDQCNGSVDSLSINRSSRNISKISQNSRIESVEELNLEQTVSGHVGEGDENTSSNRCSTAKSSK